MMPIKGGRLKVLQNHSEGDSKEDQIIEGYLVKDENINRVKGCKQGKGRSKEDYNPYKGFRYFLILFPC